ncbi:MAG TPA: TonB-dependent receptor [Acidobacteriaceae bacterium]|nr:TonB-dependent receptor [Acidobacteriaceae bacterium]
MVDAAEMPIPQQPLPVVHTLVHVSAADEGFTTGSPSPSPFHAGVAEIQVSAGTFGDFSSYLQTFPGVIGTGDWSNEMVVRGGNPVENLMVVDGIEVPNLSQLSLEESSGGLLSMIDSPAIRDVDFYTGGYDASYSEKLSSVVAIHTGNGSDKERHAELNFGYIGLGGLGVMPLGGKGSVMGSFHHSLLNLVTGDIGLGGTPVYTNMLLRGDVRPGSVDQISFLSLSGWDSIDITPGGAGHDDTWQTDFVDEQYGGWRATNGVRWLHGFSPRTLGTLTASDFEQESDIRQELQAPGSAQGAMKLWPVPVYAQASGDGRSNLKYDIALDSGRRWTAIAGVGGSLNRVNYRIAQPMGEQSPLSTNSAATDADSFSPNFLSGESASYAELTYRPFTRWSLSGGGRVQSFALGGHWTATPRLNTALRLSQHTGLHAAFGEYAQMPPTLYMTAWPQNRDLPPIRARHIIAGADLYSGRLARIGIEAYQKKYWDYPVSAQYRSLSLANMVDDLEGQILWIPLTSQGTGVARGVELSAGVHPSAHFSGQVSLAYAHTDYAAQDRVLRPGNFDYPIVGTTSGTWHSGSHYEASWRYQYTSGHPYTPYLFEESARQNRPIYDLAQINALRGPVYSRMDFEVDRSFIFGSRRLVGYFGLDNAWNRKNFLGYAWMPNAASVVDCSRPEACQSEVYDFQRFPDGGLRFSF